jgi:peptidase E
MAADGRRHVLAIGGGMLMPRDTAPLQVKYAMELTGRPRPKLCVLNTAVGDDPNAYLRVYDRLAETPARVRHLALFPMPNVADPEDLLMSQDVIFVGGGSVANMIAVWRVHGIDEILRKAWQAGIVLAGSSAGGICWFEGGTTDSFGIKLRAFTDGLAMLPGSFCPHYNSEAERRPLYRQLVADGALPGGIACDDGAGAHYTDETLAELVADRPEANAYRVERGGVETPLPVRFLGALRSYSRRSGGRSRGRRRGAAGRVR